MPIWRAVIATHDDGNGNRARARHVPSRGGKENMNPRRLLVAALWVLLAGSFAVGAQQPPYGGADVAAADAAYTAKDWGKALALYQQLAVTDPKVPRYWYRQGFALQALGQHEKALAAFTKSQ